MLEVDPPWVEKVVQAKPCKHIPVVLTREEVKNLLDHLKDRYVLVARLLQRGATPLWMKRGVL